MARKKGFKHSEESKKKMSISRKGQIPWIKGKKTGYCYWRGKKMSKETKQKMSEAHKGEKCNFWKGGISRSYKTGYYSAEYKRWRMAVFERDNWTCQFCGIRGNQTGGYLTAHHIKSFSKFPNLRFIINNGITLCDECHKLTDNYKGKSNK